MSNSPELLLLQFVGETGLLQPSNDLQDFLLHLFPWTDRVPELKLSQIGLSSQNWWSDRSLSYPGLTLENPDQSVMILGPTANQSAQSEVSNQPNLTDYTPCVRVRYIKLEIGSTSDSHIALHSLA